MLGLSGFYPKFVKKYANLNIIIKKAVKQYTREVKIKKFPAKKNFYMEQNLEDRVEFREKAKSFFIKIKKK